MQNIIEKILNSKKNAFEQINYLTLVLARIPNENEKIKLLLILIEKTLHSLTEDQVIFFEK